MSETVSRGNGETWKPTWGGIPDPDEPDDLSDVFLLLERTMWWDEDDGDVGQLNHLGDGGAS